MAKDIEYFNTLSTETLEKKLSGITRRIHYGWLRENKTGEKNYQSVLVNHRSKMIGDILYRRAMDKLFNR